jgi:hypothetical protein
MRIRFFQLLTLAFAFAGTASAQTNSASQPASVTFKFSWQQAHPSSYIVVIHNDGAADYDSQDSGLTSPQQRNWPVESNAAQVSQTQEAQSQDPLHKHFRASDTLVKNVFSLAEKTHHFAGDFEFRKHPIAQSGIKTLIYDSGSEHHYTTYNWSEDQAIQELTSIFEGISNTIEAARKLEFDRRFEKLELDEDLGNLEKLSNDGRLQEVQIIAPLLRELSSDRTVLHMAQLRAERILKKAGLSVAPTTAQ